jgi:hypothetical protein
MAEEVAAAIRPHLASADWVLNIVNIDADAALQARYNLDVPVLCSGGIELCRHFLDQAAVLSWITGKP